MKKSSHFKRSEDSFASREGLENISLNRENHRFDPVESDNPLNELLKPKNDPCVDSNFKANKVEKYGSLECEDTENKRSEGKNSNANDRLHCEEKMHETNQCKEATQSSSTDSINVLLSIAMDQIPTEPCLAQNPSNHYQQEDVSNSDFVLFRPYPNRVQSNENSASINNDDNNEDMKDIDMEAIPATPKYSELVSKENKDFLFHQDDSNSIGSGSVIGSSSPSIPAIPRAFSEPSSSRSLQTSSNRKEMVGPLRRKSGNSCSSHTSPSGSIKSGSRSVVSSLSSPSQRKLKREGSSSPILMRKKKKVAILSDTETENSFNSSENQNDSCPTNRQSSNKEATGVSDFVSMTKRKKSEKRPSNKNGDDFLTSNDDLIAELINRMEDAAYEDQMLNKKGLPATKKVAMIHYVASQLRKKDLQPIFLEHNILSTLKEWLSPMPSGCLPCFQIRDSILRVLADFPRIDGELIRYSGIGRILEFLRNHPAETKENKEHCNSLINEWSRPSQDHSYENKVVTKKEREQFDNEIYLKYSKNKKQTASKDLSEKKPKSLDASLMSSGTVRSSVRPGDSGWCPRARVPQPSIKDYVKRPESKLNCEIKTKKQPNRFEIMTKKYQKLMRDKGTYRSGAKLSIAGNKM